MRDDQQEGAEALAELTGRHPMTLLLTVMAAGAVGVGLRYLLDAAITSRAGDAFPWSTLAINISGSLALGLVIALLAGQPVGTLARPAIGIGLIGGFTTFSAFTLEAIALMENGLLMRAGIYVAASNALGIGAAVIGLAIGRQINTP